MRLSTQLPGLFQSPFPVHTAGQRLSARNLDKLIPGPPFAAWLHREPAGRGGRYLGLRLRIFARPHVAQRHPNRPQRAARSSGVSTGALRRCTACLGPASRVVSVLLSYPKYTTQIRGGQAVFVVFFGFTPGRPRRTIVRSMRRSWRGGAPVASGGVLIYVVQNESSVYGYLPILPKIYDKNLEFHLTTPNNVVQYK